MLVFVVVLTESATETPSEALVVLLVFCELLLPESAVLVELFELSVLLVVQLLPESAVLVELLLPESAVLVELLELSVFVAVLPESATDTPRVAELVELSLP